MRNALGYDIPEGYTLKSYKAFTGMDFQAWEAVIYRGKTRAGIVVDRGTGGGAWGQWDSGKERELFHEWMKTCPNGVSPDPSNTMCDSEEWALATLGVAAEITKVADQLSKTRTLFLVGDQDPVQGWDGLTQPYSESVHAYLLKECPNQRIRVWFKGEGWVTIHEG